ncbi:hypothetical protein DIPPA_25830 [Diplonema papillatum]|nr:hypothetical protein DIPPA_25830 [Diplonema papillatum]
MQTRSKTDPFRSFEFNNHFVEVAPPGKQRWELSYAERRRLAADPRIQKTVLQEDQFSGLNVDGIWQKAKATIMKHVQLAAAAAGQPAPLFPPQGWVFDMSSFTLFCRQCGMSSDHLIHRLCNIFDKDASGTISAVLLTWHLHQLINDPEETRFAETAYDIFDRKLGETDVKTSYFLSLKIPDPNAGSKRGKKAKPSASSDKGKGSSGMSFAILEAVKKCLRDHPRADPNTVTLADFRKWWADPELVAAFLCTILEVTAHLFHQDGKELPKVPPALMKSLEPVSEVPFSDADWWLLKEYERVGRDPILEAGGKKSKSRSRSKKKK